MSVATLLLRDLGLRVLVTPKECWEWQLARNSFGYGRVVNKYAHRLAYIATHGPIPFGYELDHLCRNPPCINPLHLEVVTPAENMRRGNGWSGRKAKQTHCINGHAFTRTNTYYRPDRFGRSRGCRVCRRARFLAWTARNK